MNHFTCSFSDMVIDQTSPETSGLCLSLNYDLSQVKSRKLMEEDCSNAVGTVVDIAYAVGTVPDIAYAVGLMHEIAYTGCLHSTLGSSEKPFYEEATGDKALLWGCSDCQNQLTRGKDELGPAYPRERQARDSPDDTLKPPASGQDWVHVFHQSSLELPRQKDNKSISGLQGLFLPAEEGFGLGLPDAVIEDLLSWEGRKIVGCLDDKTLSRCCQTRDSRPELGVNSMWDGTGCSTL
jgi:hypothetical protein